ncbi:MAG: ATP-binding protein, partial [Clostridium baratii]|nr:ATP-binding protein [Clostridium baratii]
MKFYKYKWNRIRASDKSLVFHFSISILSIIFIILLTVFNVKQIAEINWKNINLFSENGLSFSLTTYNILTIILSISI